METTKQFYERAKAVAGAKSDYEFAKTLGLTRAAVSKYVTGKSSFDDEVAEQIAGILGLEPGYVMACAHAERSKDTTNRARWLRVAALLAAAVIPPAAGAASHNAAGFSESNQPVNWHYVNLRQRIIRRLFGSPGFALA